MCVSPYIVKDKSGNLVPVPCGHCFECLQQWSKDWRFRLNSEKRSSSACFFLTLTYRPECLPVAYNDEAGEYQSFVSKKELQGFFKRVRFHNKNLKFRYFAVGEYGGKYNRAHYHVVFFFHNTDGLTQNQLYRLFLYCWQGRGFIYLKPTENRHINYVSAYFNKVDKSPHLVKPFKLMSKSIGLCYLTDRMTEYFFKSFKPSLPNPFGKGWVKLPRYYRKKLDEMTEKVLPCSYGLTWSDIMRGADYEPKGINTYFDTFCKDYDNIFRDVYRNEVRICRQHGFSLPSWDYDSINVVFNLWCKDIPDLANARFMAKNKLDDALVHHKFTKLKEIEILHGVTDNFP